MKTSDIVLQLINNSPDSNNALYVLDNWFVSPYLFERLFEEGIAAVGTLLQKKSHHSVIKSQHFKDEMGKDKKKGK